MQNQNFRDLTTVGTYVDKNYYRKYSEEFSENFSIKGKFTIEKQDIRDILNLSDQVKGIRFMWGLVDEFAPDSAHLLLIPCGANVDTSTNTHALQFHDGYLDVSGKRHTTDRVCHMISNFVKAVKREDESQSYKTITRGGFFGKNTLTHFLNQTSDATSEVHLGYNSSIKQIIPILTSIQKANGIFMNDSVTCPPRCPDEAETCVTTMAVNKHAVEGDLEVFRDFRDNDLLDLPEGALYYEMYYFLSPLVNAAISKSEYSKAAFLDQLYFQRIKPFGAMLHQGHHLKALEILGSTLSEWSANFIEEEKAI